MGRARNPNREKAKQLWVASRGTIKLKEVASQLGLSETLVRKWKSQDKWAHEWNGNVTIKKKNVTNEKIENKFLKKRKLTDKQQHFIMEYLRDFNATRAALAVGYSKKTAHTIGWEILRKPEVQAEMKRKKEVTTTELGLSIQRVIAELMKIAFADISDVVKYGVQDIPLQDEKGVVLEDEAGRPIIKRHNYIFLKNADEIDGTVISELKQTRAGVTVKLHDKLRAIEKLERYIPYLTEEEQLKMTKIKAEIKAIDSKVF